MTLYLIIRLAEGRTRTHPGHHRCSAHSIMDLKPLGLAAGIFITLVLIAAAIYFVMGQVNALLVRQEYGERIATLCTTPGGGTTSLANAPKKAKPWRALVLDDNKKHKWMGKLPDDAQADGKDKIDVVVCVSDKGKSTIESCTFQSVSDGHLFQVRRVQYYYDMVVLNAQTGQRIADLRAWGSAPSTCGTVRVGSDNDQIRGDDPSSTDFYYALMNFIYR
jgi:hypothetical protein